MKRWGQPEEVAKAVLYLVSSDSSYMTGGEFTVDGGLRKSNREVASRTYLPAPSSGSFGDVFEELNTLNSEIRSSDEARAKDAKLREEWIANITHDPRFRHVHHH